MTDFTSIYVFIMKIVFKHEKSKIGKRWAGRLR